MVDAVAVGIDVVGAVTTINEHQSKHQRNKPIGNGELTRLHAWFVQLHPKGHQKRRHNSSRYPIGVELKHIVLRHIDACRGGQNVQRHKRCAAENHYKARSHSKGIAR